MKANAYLSRRLKTATANLILGTLLISSAASASQGVDVPVDDNRGLTELQDNLKRAGKPADKAKALYALGKALAEQRRFDEAEGYLKQALELDRQVGKATDVFEDLAGIAIVQGFAKRFDRSEATYLGALEEARTAKNDRWIVKYSNELGALYIHAKKYDKAEAVFVQSRDAAAKNNDYVGEAQARLNLALLYKKSGQVQKGIGEAEAAQKLLGDDPEDQLLAGQMALNLASLREFAGDYDGACKDYKRAVEFFKGAGDFEREASASMDLGNELIWRGKAAEAADCFSSACELYDGAQFVAKLIMAKLRLGAALADQGKFTEASKIHAEAAKLAMANGDNDSYIDALYEGAFDQYLAGNADKALSKFIDLGRKLQSGYKTSDADAMAETLNGTALCCRALGQSEAAVQYYREAAQAFARNKNTLSQITAENSISCVYLDAHMMSQYESQYKKVIALLAALPAETASAREFQKLQGSIGFNYAQSKVMSGQYDEAFTTYQKAMENFVACGDRKMELKALVGLGLCKQQQGLKNGKPEDLSNALTYFKKAEPLAQTLGSLEGQWDCAIGQGFCERRVGDKAGAEANFRKAISLFEKEKGQYSRDDSKTYTLDLRASSFEELISLLTDEKRHDEALEIAERGRARAFLDLLEGRRRNVFGRDRVAAITGGDGLSPTIAPAADKPSARVEVAMLPEAMVRSVDILPREFASGSNSISSQLDTALSPVNAQAPDLNELRSLIRNSHGWVLEYFAGPDRLYTWLVNPQGNVETAAVTAINHSALISKVSASYQSIITPPKNFADLANANRQRQENLVELYKILIAPVRDKLPANADEVITVVPHAELFKVPFAALTDASGKLLIEEHTLATTPAIGVFRATQKIASDMPQGKDKLLAFGNPTLKVVAGLGALPYAEKEVQKLASIFGADNSTIKIGVEANKQNLRELAPGSSVIHLATHGLIDEERPMDSAVLLSGKGDDDGILSVKEILQLPPLKAKLVTLSACQTGRGKITGDGVAGLSRAFIIAGTPSVLVSLWNVDDVMTEYQMEAFYRDYLKGEHKARSLRDAQLKTIAFMEKGMPAGTMASGVKIRANPRYWAAFQLVGNNE